MVPQRGQRLVFRDRPDVCQCAHGRINGMRVGWLDHPAKEFFAKAELKLPDVQANLLKRDSHDFRHRMLFHLLCSVAREEGEADPWSDTSRATLSLLCARRRDPTLDEHAKAPRGIVLPLLDVPGINDVHNVVDRDRGLSDVCGQDELPDPFWWVLENPPLLLGGDVRVEWEHPFLLGSLLSKMIGRGKLVVHVVDLCHSWQEDKHRPLLKIVIDVNKKLLDELVVYLFLVQTHEIPPRLRRVINEGLWIVFWIQNFAPINVIAPVRSNHLILRLASH
mmetsp:Transcript_2152/g.5874  ORF Transcript_2152/g.5874 Transcript_2152/m.5874 type:complete len:278 (-) Transcript_2152:226-1059(-)